MWAEVRNQAPGQGRSDRLAALVQPDPPALDAGLCQPGAVRRKLVDQSTPASQCMRAPMGYGFQGQGQFRLTSRCLAFTALPRCRAAQALVARHPSRRGRSPARLLRPRRIYLPLQPPNLAITRHAVLSVDSAICRRRAFDLRQHLRQPTPSSAFTRTHAECGAKWIALHHCQQLLFTLRHQQWALLRGRPP